MKNIYGYYLGAVMLLTLSGCYPDEGLNVPVNEDQIAVETALDQYINDKFVTEYGMAIRYRFSDNFVDPGQSVAPSRIESVRPMLDFIEEFWINPYKDVQNGEEFFRNHVPAEIIFLGGVIYDANGNLLLGLAEAGAKITFTDVNSVDPTDSVWRRRQLNTVYHEFAHTVHQRYKLPNAFETIAAEGYTGPGSWFVLTDDDALQRGFVSPYSTSSPNEDFAECVSFFLFDPNFETNFMDMEAGCVTEDCVGRNDGRLRIAEKIAAIKDHYKKVTGVDLESLRAAIQSKL
ncbi:MAG: substrate import-associated zinc metallohydrolase lipoprotein [Cyclobacteriaceae bacterium]